MTEQDENEVNNLELWEKVCVTDPAFTKKVNQRGGFTAIGAQYQLKCATEQWGPYGYTWGVKDLEWGEVRSADGALMEITLDAVFYFPERLGEGSFPISSCCAYKVGNDTRKKLLTDLTTKALSKLGFNADVFMGAFDDNKYVGDKAEPSAQDVHEPAKAPQSTPAAGGEKLKRAKAKALEYAQAGGEWLQTEELRFGKYKGSPWLYLTQGSPDGDRAGWLEWLAGQDPTTDKDGSPVDDKRLFGNLITHYRARVCLDMIEQAAKGDWEEEVPF